MAMFYDDDKEKTEVIYPNEDIIGIALQDLSKTRKSLDLVGDCDGPRFLVTNEQIATKYLELKNRGVKIRIVTEITKDNIAYCRKAMEFSQLRHLDGVKGTYGINDARTFGSIIIDKESKKPLHFVHSNVKPLVEQEQYLFETLWEKAIPAKQRFKEIEEGAKREFVETIREPSEIQKLGIDLIKKAEEEILVLFSTANAFPRQDKAGALDLLREAAKLHGVKVRILVPIGDNDNNDAISERIQQMKDAGIDIRAIKQTFQNKLTTLVVDQSLCLTIELKDDSRETSDEAIGLATYSNSEASVFSYISIFENLWIRMKMYKKPQQQEA